MTLQQLLSPFRAAIEKYRMIEEGDGIAVGLSGGKDSVALLTLLAALQKFYPKPFKLCAIRVDMGFSNTDKEEIAALKAYCEGLGVAYEEEQTQIGEILFDIRKESNPCSLCSKLRRGALNTAAVRLGMNKLALGHHADDMMQTFLLSAFFEGRLSTFAPLSYMSKTGVTLIRPIIWMREKDITAFMRDKPVLHNPCPANKHTKREDMKEFLTTLKQSVPFAEDRLLTALIHPDRYNLFDKFEKDCEELQNKNYAELPKQE